MFQKGSCLLLLWGWGVSAASAQTKYWVFFKDKNLLDAPAVSVKTLENRRLQGLTLSDETDLPVKKNYLQQLQTHHCKPLITSRWLNAVSATIPAQDLEAVQQLPFVAKVQPMDGRFYIAKTNTHRRSTMAPVMTQIQAEEFKKVGLTGKGITIGVFLKPKKATTLSICLRIKRF